MKFSYRARTEEGDIESGEVEASSKEAALEVIQEYGLYPTHITPITEPFWKKGLPFVGEVSRKDVILFARQLSILIGSDISIVESLETIARQSSSEGLKNMLLKVAEKVEGGSPLSRALSGYPDVFSPFYVGMIRSAEKAGRLPEVLKYLANHLERSRSLRMQLIGALVYPVFVTAVFLIMMVAMSVFVVPSFEQVFEDMDIELPALTRLVIGAADIIRGYWWSGVLLIGVGVGVLAFLLQDKSVKREVDKFLLDLPLIGGLLKKTYLSQLSLNLSTLISSGVPISESLETTADLMNNGVYKERIVEARKDVRAGRSIVSAFTLYPEYFPNLFIQMIVAGEKTGSLENTLRKVYDYYEEEVQVSLERMLRLIEPIMIVVLGGLVLVLGMSLFLPLFQGGALAV